MQGDRPEMQTCFTLAGSQERSEVVAVRILPKKFARLTTKRIIGFGNGRDGDYAASNLSPFNLVQHAPSDILLMPTDIHQYALAPGLEPCREVVEIPVPALLSYRF